MSGFVVVDGESGWLTARGASIFWEKEPGDGDTSGSATVQLRWMIHPDIGLPLQPFKVWRRARPSGTRDKQKIANLPGWIPVEAVGLPVGKDWRETGYALDDQGLEGQETTPYDAALKRLWRGAPRKGWMSQTASGNRPEAWERPSENEFLKHVVQGHVFRGLADMLIDEPSPRLHRSYSKEVAASRTSDLLPHLLLDDVVGNIGDGEAPRGEWSPLDLMLMAASTDPLAALAYGFGTALEPVGSNDIYKISLRHSLDPASGVEIELADVVFPAPLHQRVPAPKGLSANRSRVTRPQRLDRAAMETTAISWDRPDRPMLQQPLTPETAFAVAYTIARFGGPREEMLLTRRDYAGGWEPYVPGLSRENEPIAFQDHLHKTRDGTGYSDPYPGGLDVVYAVAGQDLFGRWSDWREIEYTIPPEAPSSPKLLSVRIDGEMLIADFAWDWSDRSPEFIELEGAWMDAPTVVIATAKAIFAGRNMGDCDDGRVWPLGQDREPCEWGAEQDKNPLEPGTRYYRWRLHITVDLLGAGSRSFGVRARGQCHLHRSHGQNFGISSWTDPSRTRVLDSTPLPAPVMATPEAPSWASLPDAAGVSRFVLNWPAVPGAAGYIVYEATETALLDDGQAGSDISIPHHVRLTELRRRNLSGRQKSFRRLNEKPETRTSLEVALPRGSRVIHMFAVTTMSANRIEGPWPHHPRMFAAVAAPRILRPPAPGIAVAPGLAGPVVTVDLDGATGERVDLYRTTVAAAAVEVGSMGPVYQSSIATTPNVTFNDAPLPGSHRYFYRAVVWSTRDELLGFVEMPSPASPLVSILVRGGAGVPVDS